ncbi:MAG: DUF4391 domain-containing protein [Pseudomonadota bacterium]
MNTGDMIAAFSLPPEARVNQRVPKKLLVENGAPTAADRRRINEGIEELLWVAALKPTTVGVPSFRDAVREYLEIAVLSLMLHPAAKADRLMALVHRAIPYPVILVARQVDAITLSLAHKRWSQGEAGKMVLEGGVAEVRFEKISQTGWMADEPTKRFLKSLALADLPRVDLLTVYQGWMDRIHALRAARITGRFIPPQTGEHAAARRGALEAYERLMSRMADLRAQAERVSQIHRRVELNIEIKQLETNLTDAIKQMV